MMITLFTFFFLQSLILLGLLSEFRKVTKSINEIKTQVDWIVDIQAKEKANLIVMKRKQEQKEETKKETAL